MTNQAREVVCQGRFAASLINNICAGREPSARCPVDFYACLWRIVISPIIPQDSPSCYAFCDANLVVLFIHLIATLARLLGPGGVLALVAESLLLTTNFSRNFLSDSDSFKQGLV